MTSYGKIAGSLFGFAFADGWGFKTEFIGFEQAKEKFPTMPEKVLVSDDTQMGIYGLLAVKDLLENDFKLDAEPTREWAYTARQAFMKRYLQWLDDPRNDRAPGNTCLAALRTYKASDRANPLAGTEWNSFGCGANMRAPWLGLLPYDPETIARLAQLQAEVTHGHKLSGPAAVLTALVTWNIVNAEGFADASADELFEWAIETCKEYADPEFWLWRNTAEKPALHEDSVEGFTELVQLFETAKYRYPEFLAHPESDICDYFGEGWVATQALLCAWAAFLAYRNKPLEGIRRLVHSKGDSDSIAAIGASFFGAALDIEAWPKGHIAAIEADYRLELGDLAKWLSEIPAVFPPKATEAVPAKAAEPESFEFVQEAEESANKKRKLLGYWPHAGAAAMTVIAGVFIAFGVVQLNTPEYVPPSVLALEGGDASAVSTTIPDEGQALPRDDEELGPVSIRTGQWGGIAQVDRCDGTFIGLTDYARVEGLQDTYAAHNRCGGDQILYLDMGEVFFVNGEEYVVTDLRDLRKRESKVSELLGMEGDVIFQSCFYNSSWMRFVAAEKLSASTTA